MKALKVIAKIVLALAAVAGIVYVIAVYGERIVAWARKLLNRFTCCCDCDCDDDDDDCCCGHDHDEEDLFDGGIYEITCPKCGEIVCMDEEMLFSPDCGCPNCGTSFEVDFDGVECCDDDCCCHDHEEE